LRNIKRTETAQASNARSSSEEKITVKRIFFALIVTIIFSIPLYLVVVNTFKTNSQVISNPMAFPSPITLVNVANILNGSSYGFWIGLAHSLVIVVPSLFGAVTFGAMAGYYLGRSHDLLARGIQGLLLIGLMLPFQVLLLPLSIMLRQFHLGGTYLGIVLFNIAYYLPFAAFVFSGFIKSIPLELEEAAQLDGASNRKIFTKIIIPLLRPATASAMIFIAVWIWNDFLNPLVLLGPGLGTTVTTGIYLAMGQFRTDYGSMFAIMMLSALPILVFFLALQKSFVAGLMSGSTKG
jgi:raffinose/stachyose/melibiose transport system permease protein